MKSTIAPTKAEKTRIDRIRHFGCIACLLVGLSWHQSLELHHILEGNRRLGHRFTIFLCRGHHQGHWSDIQKTILPGQKGISDGRKAFVAAVGHSERQLWEITQQMIGEDLAWPESKILRRPSPK